MNRPAQGAHGDLSMKNPASLPQNSRDLRLIGAHLHLDFVPGPCPALAGLFIPHESALTLIDLATVSGRCTSRPDFGERWPSRLVATASEDRLSFQLPNNQEFRSTRPLNWEC
jgi:hypothetical protein